MTQMKGRTKKNKNEPALFPLVAAFLRPIFLIIKLEPMKMLEDRANTSPITLSEDITMMMFHHNIKMVPTKILLELVTN
jgi:hypothetical protein